MGNNLGKNFEYGAISTFADVPPGTFTTDPRTGYQKGMEERNLRQTDALANQYQASLQDPNYGLPDNPQQLQMEQEVIDSVYNRLGSGGSLGSGSARAAAAKGIADYRLGLLREQAAQRQKLRGDVIASTQGAPGQSYAITPREGAESSIRAIGSQAAASSMGGMGGGMCWIAAAIYGYGSLEHRAARRFIVEQWRGPVASCVRFFYGHFGRSIAESPFLCKLLKPLFDRAVAKGVKTGL